MTKVENISHGKAQNGEIIGTTAAVVMPSVACSMVMFIAVSTNTGSVFIGGSGVTVLDTTATTTTTGIELVASANSGWIPVNNLHVLYLVGDSAGDDVTYLALG